MCMCVSALVTGQCRAPCWPSTLLHQQGPRLFVVRPRTRRRPLLLWFSCSVQASCGCLQGYAVVATSAVCVWLRVAVCGCMAVAVTDRAVRVLRQALILVTPPWTFPSTTRRRRKKSWASVAHSPPLPLYTWGLSCARQYTESSCPTAGLRCTPLPAPTPYPVYHLTSSKLTHSHTLPPTRLTHPTHTLLTATNRQPSSTGSLQGQRGGAVRYCTSHAVL